MRPRNLRTLLAVTSGLCGSLLLGSAAHAQNLPSGASFGAGSGSYTQSGTTGTVTLNSERTIINWNSFSIASGFTVTHDLTAPGANNAVLHRVIGGDASSIMGTLYAPANLQVYLLNPNGVVIGSGANVDVGGLVAGTLGLTDADFLNGDSVFSFSGTGITGITVASGARVSASAGPLVLLGGFVSTAGTLNASGDVAIAAASDVTISMAAGSPLSMTISQGTPIGGTVVNAGGTINGNNVYLAVASRTGVMDALLNVSGTVTATGATASDRGIVLTAGTSASGVTVASGGGNDTAGSAAIQLTGTLNSASDVEIRSSGSVSGGGSVVAADDFNASANGIVLSSVNAGSDIVILGGATGVGNGAQSLALSAGDNLVVNGGLRGLDVALRAGGTVTTGSITTRDDVVVRAGGAVTTGAVTTGTTVDSLAAADVTASADMLAGATLVGADVDIVSNGIVLGPVRANGDNADIRLDGGASGIGNGAVDLDLQAAGVLQLSSSARGRDVALRARRIEAGSITARDDIAIRSAALIADSLTSGVTVDALGPVDVAGAADAMLPGVDLTGNDIDALVFFVLQVGSAQANGANSEARVRNYSSRSGGTR